MASGTSGQDNGLVVTDEMYKAKMKKDQASALARLTQKQKLVLKEEFKLFDKDSSGFITRDEFASVLRDFGVYSSTEAEERGLDEMMAMVDKDGDCKISEEEFMIVMALSMANSISENELLEAFKVFDVDNSGAVSMENLLECITKLGPRFLSAVECKELIAAADKNGDGQLDFAEFLAFFSDKKGANKSSKTVGTVQRL